MPVVRNAAVAEVDNVKLSDYLLSLSHPVGRFKARFFLAIGFSPADVGPLRAELLRIAEESLDAEEIATPHGTKILARGILTSPTGRTASILTVWMIRTGQTIPRFVTAYPDP